MRVVLRAVVGLEYIDAGHDSRLVGGIVRVAGGNERSGQIDAAGIGEGAVSMNAVLVYVVGARQPLIVERVLNAAGNVNVVRRAVRSANHVADRRGAALQTTGSDQRIIARAARQRAASGGEVGGVRRLECGGPSVLRQIVVEDAKAGANYGVAAVADLVGEPDTRRELVVIILRQAGNHRNAQRLHRDVGGVVGFGAARTLEQPPRRLPAQAVVEGELRRHSPRVFRVERHALHVLRKAAVAGGSEGAG